MGTFDSDPTGQRAPSGHSSPEESPAGHVPAGADAAPGTGQPEEARRMDRRRLLTTGAATGVAAAAVPLVFAAVDAQDATPPADPAATPHDMAGMDMSTSAPTNVGFTVFVPYQAAIVQAAAARIIPTDENGPGATEAGVVYFIDRQIAKEGMDYRGNRYRQGPFLPGEPTQGDQSALAVRDRFRIGIFALDAYARQTFDAGFVECTPEQQDQLLADLEEGLPEGFGGTSLQAQPLDQSGSQLAPNIGLTTTTTASSGARAFFTLLRNYTIAGYFSDPVQGGNRDMVGWKMIGFPGAHISYFNEIEQYNTPFQGEYISLGQYQAQVGGEI
ncbi:MAG: Gluconate 2-dehydrogenase, membrane-bound, gamma subunit [uncultured Thermomicrobiales bacterium]|uniref:Gluconate 2-dehydrogenase, membrane-bound, gamma subunit n=1 Tax=uncultured Thermomicrobiales bacterium TaxID=1645740 RepID=A0A6J4URE1_9BACT|nr:MAG: Gluconate 2-dehydrogenase, membrane-bound, gamma subunit [uncultured Thermomicrobiales bacterium]